MCSFPIREAQFARVVFAIRSPVMGGMSRWNILRDTEISNAMPRRSATCPRSLPACWFDDAEKVWREWNPLRWGVIRYRGLMDRPQTTASRSVERRARSKSLRHSAQAPLLAELMSLHRRYRRA